MEMVFHFPYWSIWALKLPLFRRAFVSLSPSWISVWLWFCAGIPPKSFESKQLDGKDNAISNRKQIAEGGTSRTEDDKKGSNATLRPKDATELPRTEGFPSEYPTIKPGIAAELKFGGSGSYPNLPWVSTTGSGPNGRTISGVTYRYSPTQIRIVCACHGMHMSPEEFVRHASEEQTNQDTGGGVASVPSTNPAASAQS